MYFSLQNLGPIGKADIALGDLTIFVGPQASGKSIALEALKLAEDHDSIIETLDRYNYIIGHNRNKILNAYFGEGMQAMWPPDTTLSLNGKNFNPDSLTESPEHKESSIFYVPAQRIVCMGDGYPRFFSDFSFTTPYVLREFTETLRTFLQFGMGGSDTLFSTDVHIADIQQDAFDKSIFHQGEVVMTEVAGQKKMMLSTDGIHIPFMAWSAGQKEFMPLLLAFYCLAAPPSSVGKRERYSTVVIEEPEMGLHPKAIVSILIQICQLLAAGYKVILSTHSSILLEFAWAFNTLQGNSDRFHQALCILMQVDEKSPEADMLAKIVDKSVRIYSFSRKDASGKVETEDISSLDVMSDIPALSEWGGISEFSTRVNNVVSEFLR